MTKPFSTLLGSEVLSYVRDAVTDVAAKKRSYLEQSAAIGGTPVTASELAEARALDAAAEMAQFALTAGQEAQARGKPAPDWVHRMVAQIRATLVASED
jgi:hypothetical protein